MMCEAELYRDLGNELLIRRQYLGLSQDKVVERCSFYGLDICQQIYSAMESGARPLRCHELVVLSIVLEMNMWDYLMRKVGGTSCKPQTL